MGQPVQELRAAHFETAQAAPDEGCKADVPVGDAGEVQRAQRAQRGPRLLLGDGSLPQRLARQPAGTTMSALECCAPLPSPSANASPQR